MTLKVFYFFFVFGKVFGFKKRNSKFNQSSIHFCCYADEKASRKTFTAPKDTTAANEFPPLDPLESPRQVTIAFSNHSFSSCCSPLQTKEKISWTLFINHWLAWSCAEMLKRLWSQDQSSWVCAFSWTLLIGQW